MALNSSVVTSVLFGFLLFLLPFDVTAGGWMLWMVPAVAVILLSLIFAKPFDAVQLFAPLPPAGKKILSLHALLYLSVIRMFAVIGAFDVLLTFTLSQTHTIFMIGLIVFAGLIAVTGSLWVIQRIETIAAGAAVTGVLLLCIDTFVFSAPIASVFHSSLFHHAVPAGISSAWVNSPASVIIAAAVVLFWLLWMKPGGEISHESTRASVVRTILLSAVGIVAVTVLLQRTGVPGQFTALPETTAVNAAAVFCAVSVIFALFVSTFYSIGLVFSRQVYPQWHLSVSSEKQSLMNKLATVFSVIFAILMIPVARDAGSGVVISYVGFLCVFSAPLVAIFLISAVGKKNSGPAKSASLLIGLSYGAAEWGAWLLSGRTLFGGADHLFDAAAGGLFVTGIGYAVLVKAGELVVVQKLISKSKI